MTTPQTPEPDHESLPGAPQEDPNRQGESDEGNNDNGQEDGDESQGDEQL